MEDLDNKKINIPAGLCVNKVDKQACTPGCICCLVSNICYDTYEICMVECVKASYSASVNSPLLPFP
jgi:hypothetical protein